MDFGPLSSPNYDPLDTLTCTISYCHIFLTHLFILIAYLRMPFFVYLLDLAVFSVTVLCMCWP